ncbi:Uncharacterised protein [Candidatus Gugararchaeum adminiculabundum]|nr:Uncharacterised protein [Candidatus Gugararchaeum adminiculabundum]
MGSGDTLGFSGRGYKNLMKKHGLGAGGAGKWARNDVFLASFGERITTEKQPKVDGFINVMSTIS